MSSKGFYTLRRMPSHDKIEEYLETAKKYMQGNPPSSAFISFEPPKDIPSHELDQHLAYKRDHPEVVYIVFV